jgi:hypothetical protein
MGKEIAKSVIFGTEIISVGIISVGKAHRGFSTGRRYRNSFDRAVFF